ncbi:ribonuclease H-like domain-containing protein [Tanacetum coccineum]|uniref:Ribonuclease H-like domain-containing protein n=1 Tax=Tanacetum coccineum TaxID=301880 RepID=A0ABQ5BQB5_9ASTR
MQKNVLKHQFENFSTASNKSLDKVYDRFQKLISQLEVHGAPISKEDINQKFLRSLPSSWNQIALIMRNKPDIDEIDIDDLYNNLRVYEDELKSTASGDFGVSTAGGINQVPSTPCAHDIAYSFLAQPTTSPQLENEDFQQMDGDDLEELDLRWQVAMLTVRVKKFIQRTGRNMDFKEKRHVSLDKSKIECYNCHRKGHFARECRSRRSQGRRSYGDNGRSNAPTNESSSQALVAQDGLGGYDWINDFEVEPVNHALMAISSSSSSSSSDNEEESTKNLEEILKSQMSARDKTGLGYSTQLNELSSNHETDSENSLSIFDGRSSDDEHIPENDRFLKNGYKVVPPPITRDSVIIEDWTLDDEEEVFGVQKVRPENQTVKTRDNKSGQNSHKQGVGRPRQSWESTRSLNDKRILVSESDSSPLCKSGTPVDVPSVRGVHFYERFQGRYAYILLIILPEFESFSDHKEETRSGSTTTHANYSLPEYESFHFDNPSLPRPPPEPLDVCLDMLYNDESFKPGEGENIVVSNVEEDDSFKFTIRTFLPFLTYLEVSPLYCSTRSEDLIFDPGIVTFHKPVDSPKQINEASLSVDLSHST